MNPSIDITHDPNLRSWVQSANQPNTDFPIQNLPFGVFQIQSDRPQIGVAIGDQILSLVACCEQGLLTNLADPLQLACQEPTLNQFMSLGRASALALRHRLSEVLREDSPVASDQLLVPMAQANSLVPANIGDYTDFYASIFHATNVGKLFRPDQPLLPNYKYVPIAYHGRASSIVVSGTPIPRPYGQRKPPENPIPQFEASRSLDYELEVGIFVGKGNALGDAISINEAEDHIFGLCLVNDWSARDMQAWEYQPLGPFLAKSFATTVSPWVVTLEALAPFRCPAEARSPDDPQPLPYLTASSDSGSFDLTLEVWFRSAQMQEPIRLSRGSFRHLYWTIAQMVTHHTSNGCNLRSGDLLASGTVSGAELGAQGCLLEITKRGATPLTLPNGEQRSFLLEGDEIRLHGFCEKPGYARIGFGDCVGTIAL
jgi:fumarylacetoacetase